MERKVTFDVNKGKTQKITCAVCAGVTDHEVQNSLKIVFSHSEYMFWEEYEILECRGCHDVAFRKSSWGEEDYEWNHENNDWDVLASVEVYPSRLGNRKQLGNAETLPSDIRRVYKEVYQALCNQQAILCAAGLRILLERICKNVEVDGENLEKRIDALKQKDICSGADAVLLHGTRIFGNEVIHTSDPIWGELEAAFDVIEHLLNTIYILPSKTKMLREREEKRHKPSIKVV